MKDPNKYYRKVLSKNTDHVRWLMDFFKMMFQMVKKWTLVDYVPKARLLATMRIYVDNDGIHYIKLGNHSSHTAGYWFKQEESNHENRNQKDRTKATTIESDC